MVLSECYFDFRILDGSGSCDEFHTPWNVQFVGGGGGGVGEEYSREGFGVGDAALMPEAVLGLLSPLAAAGPGIRVGQPRPF